MFIESWIILAVIIWIIYLLWRVEKLKSGIQSLSPIIDEYTKKEMMLRRELISLLLMEDKRFLAKASKKTRDKVLTEQANDIRIIFANSHLPDYYINGQIIKDSTVEEYLRDAFNDDMYLDYVESEADFTNQSIKDAMERRMNGFD